MKPFELTQNAVMIIASIVVAILSGFEVEARTYQWDVGPGETASFPAKWIDADGRKLWLVFSGDDCFSVRAATIVLTGAADSNKH